MEFEATIRGKSHPAKTSLQAEKALPRIARLGHKCPPVLRLGLATRDDTRLEAEDVAHALKRGVNYLNWCGRDDALAEAVRKQRFDREKVVIAFQLEGRTKQAASHELANALETLQTNRIDVVAFYYMEEPHEWEEITRPGGAMEAVEEAQQLDKVRLRGLTTHQRAFGAKLLDSKKLDLLMIRYNAAHRGAEREVFPVTDQRGIPVVAFTAQRWGALCGHTAEDPPGFSPPPTSAWYRFALHNPSVSVVLMAPVDRRELDEDLALLDDWRPPSPEELQIMLEHGARVRKHAGRFP
jgi:predicted aldo/keto reductase-like oxidoreductase